MTIPVQDAVTSSVANGLTTVFPFGFKILSESDLLVLLDDVEATAGFTVSGIGEETGGNVTFDTAPANGVKVTRALQPELKRDVDYQQFGDWVASEANNDFDRLWLALQMLNHNDKRSLRISIENTIDQTILETPAERAGKIIGFDASGNVILYAGNDIDVGLVSSMIATFLATTSQLDARNIIGAGDMLLAQAQSQYGVSFTTAGSAGTLAVTTTPAYGALVTGQRMRLKFNVASTGADTLNRDATGAKSLKQYDSAGAKVAAVFAANQLVDVVYDGTDYVLLSSLQFSLPAQTGNAGRTLKTNGSVVSWDGAGVLGTSVASTSGTAIDFTGIPSWVKRVTLLMSGLSSNGSSIHLVRVGAGSIQSSGYSASGQGSTGTAFSGSVNTTGVPLGGDNAASYVLSGRLVFEHLGGNVWSVAGNGGGNDAGGVRLWNCGGTVTLSGALDRIRLTTVNGTDAFDAGLINILYE